MATKGALWVWLTLLAARGAVVFCFYLPQQHQNAVMQLHNGEEQEMPASPPPHHYKINKIHSGGITFFMLT